MRVSHLNCNEKKLLLYKGESMFFTLRSFDRLKVERYGLARRIQVGDVICFSLASTPSIIVHRVVGIYGEYIKTRGDNHDFIDPWTITVEDITGQVVYGYRGKRRFLVYGGFIGRCWAFWLSSLRRVKKIVYYFLKPLYLQIINYKFIKEIFFLLLRIRRIKIRASDFEVHLFLGKRVIARYSSWERRWRITKLFRFLLDEKKLNLYISDQY